MYSSEIILFLTVEVYEIDRIVNGGFLMVLGDPFISYSLYEEIEKPMIQFTLHNVRQRYIVLIDGDVLVVPSRLIGHTRLIRCWIRLNLVF